MISRFFSSYPYDVGTVRDWQSSTIGVYYCGIRTSEGNLIIFYIGSACGEGGIRSRLLQHLAENKWQDVTHFGYHQCDSEAEAREWEMSEIKRYKPKYNTVGV